MIESIMGWLTTPVVLPVVLGLLAMLILLSELTLKALAEMGNVRFQGMLEDHRPRLSGRLAAGVHASRLLDGLRWLELTALVLFVWGSCALKPFPLWARIVVSIGVPVVLVSLSRWLSWGVSEEVVVRLLRVLRLPLVPFVAVARFSGRAQVPGEDEEEVSDREIRAFIDVGRAAGILEGDESRFFKSLVEFFDTTVREVMTPRTEMVAVSEDASFDELMEVFAESQKSRVPLYRGTVDTIVGVVHVKDAVAHLLRGQRPAPASLGQEYPVVPETRELGQLLRQFQLKHRQLAIIVDEYGGTVGLVTLEDVLEEIVGEIEDEHDEHEPPEWELLEPGVVRFQGRAGLDLLQDVFGVGNLDDVEVDTVGGWVFAHHGTVPVEGDVVVDASSDLEFTVESMDGRRIVSVTARRIGGGENHETDGDDG